MKAPCQTQLVGYRQEIWIYIGKDAKIQEIWRKVIP